MEKKTSFKIILLAVIFSLFTSIFFTRYLTAQISTLPLLNRLKILSPQAPIVINKREEVRISDSGDILTSVQTAESKISALVYVDKSKIVLAGSVLNLTSDGVFVGALEILSKSDSVQYFVVSRDGKAVPVNKISKDLVLGVVFLKTNSNSASVVALGNSVSLKPGEKVVVISTNLNSFNQVDSRLVSVAQNDTFGKNFSADSVVRSFKINSSENLTLGQILLNLKGECVGLWNGSRIISSDALRHGFALNLKNNGQAIYPKFGFEYGVISLAESSLLIQPQGLLVSAISLKSPAYLAGLKLGDIILQIQENTFEKNDVLPEEVLQKYLPGQKLTFKINRSKEILNLVLTLGEIK